MKGIDRRSCYQLHGSRIGIPTTMDHRRFCAVGGKEKNIASSTSTSSTLSTLAVSSASRKRRFPTSTTRTTATTMMQKTNNANHGAAATAVVSNGHNHPNTNVVTAKTTAATAASSSSSSPNKKKRRGEHYNNNNNTNCDDDSTMPRSQQRTTTTTTTTTNNKNGNAPSRTQTDVQRLLDALSAYVVYGTNSNVSNKSSNMSIKDPNPGNSNSNNNEKSNNEKSEGRDSSVAAPPPHIDRIPRLLVSLIGTHCEIEPAAVAVAARGIVAILRDNGNSVVTTIQTPTPTPTRFGAKSKFQRLYQRQNKDQRQRKSIVRDKIVQALRSGGMERVLQALQKLGPSYYNHNFYNSNNNNNQSSSSQGGGGGNVNNTVNNTVDSAFVAAAKKEAILGCWAMTMAGVSAGLSRSSLLLVVQSCLADMDEIRLTNDQNNSGDHNHQNNNNNNNKNSLEVLSCILQVLTDVLSLRELSPRDLAYDKMSILSTCLNLLAKACGWGVCPEQFDQGQQQQQHQQHQLPPIDATVDDISGTALGAINTIEAILKIFVVCARKGVLRGSDFERLVPACQASMSRFVLEGLEHNDNNKGDIDNDNSNDNDNGVEYGGGQHLLRKRTIPVLVTELVEIEDKTMGLWLRLTFGIPPPPSNILRSGNDPSKVQSQLQSQPSLSNRHHQSGTNHSEISNGGGGGGVWKQDHHPDRHLLDRNPNRTRGGQGGFPLPQRPPSLYRSFTVVGEPEKVDSNDYDDDDDDDDDDESDEEDDDVVYHEYGDY